MSEASTKPPVLQDRPRMAARFRREIDQMLSPIAREESSRLEAALGQACSSAWAGVKRHPIAATAAMIGFGFASAELFGVPEVVLALSFGYVAYEVLKRGASPEAAIAEIVRLET